MLAEKKPLWTKTVTQVALDSLLKSMCFKQSVSDPCIYTSSTDGLFIFALYVDDILQAGESESKWEEVKPDLGK